MLSLSRDTDLAAERVQLDLLRAATPARRFQMSQSMTSEVLRLQRRALREQHAEADECEIGLLAVALNYGDELATRVRAYVSR